MPAAPALIELSPGAATSLEVRARILYLSLSFPPSSSLLILDHSLKFVNGSPVDCDL
jgi:hypothetical protein